MTRLSQSNLDAIPSGDLTTYLNHDSLYTFHCFCFFLNDCRCEYGTRCDIHVEHVLFGMCTRCESLWTNLQNEYPSLALANVASWLLHQWVQDTRLSWWTLREVYCLRKYAKIQTVQLKFKRCIFNVTQINGVTHSRERCELHPECLRHAHVSVSRVLATHAHVPDNRGTTQDSFRVFSHNACFVLNKIKFGLIISRLVGSWQ